MIKKTVRLRFIVEAEGEYPDSWTNKQIEEYEYNEGMYLNLPPSEPDSSLHVISCEVIAIMPPSKTGPLEEGRERWN